MYCADCDISELADRIMRALVDAEDATVDAREVIYEALLWSGEEPDRCDL